MTGTKNSTPTGVRNAPKAAKLSKDEQKFGRTTKKLCVGDWAHRFNYTPPPAYPRGPKETYHGPSKRIRHRRLLGKRTKRGK